MDEEDEGLPAYMTPLYLAIMDRDFERARTLVMEGYAVDKEPTDEGYTLLHDAAQHGDVEVIRFLLSVGCVVALNSFDYVQHTPLIWAAEEGRLEIARMLIAAGADINAHNEAEIGNTAIREAARAGDLRMVELLLEAGADPTIPGWMGIDAVLEAKHQAKENPTSEARRKIVELLDRTAPPGKAG